MGLVAIISGLSAVIALFKSWAERSFLGVSISVCSIAASVMIYIDYKSMFFHILSLLTIILVSLVIELFIVNWNSRLKASATFILLPLLIVIIFKLFQLQGAAPMRWILTLSVLAFLHFTFEHRKWDRYWFIYFFLTLMSGYFLWGAIVS